MFVSTGFANDRGAVAENGGQMAGKNVAKLKQAERKKKARREQGGATGVEATAGTVAAASSATNVRTAAGAPGSEEPSTTAAKAAGEKRKSLAKILRNNTLDGDVQGFKELFSLAAKKKESKDKAKKRKRPSLALKWASAPEWRDEQAEAAGETGGGSVEPEG